VTTCQVLPSWTAHPCPGEASATWIHHGNVSVPVCDRHASLLRQGSCTVISDDEEAPMDD
jgi:hypothetical protein